VLHHAQKLESIGQLTSGVAHDFNNLLTAVLGNLEIACMRVTDESVLKLLASATRAAERGAHLNEQLLAFARKQHLQSRPVNVNELVRGMGEMLKHSIGASVHIEQHLASDLWPAMADENQVELAILNLAINARDAMPVGGRLSIETTNSDSGDPHRPAELSPGDYVCIAVSDTGTGMSEEVASRVLEPFFTTKGPGQGSGLGLSMVYGVAKQSGGGLSLSTRIREGTTVRIYLPRAAGMQKMHSYVPAASEIGVNALSGTSVLLIDDDADVRQVTTTVLIHLGCRVEPTDSGVAALALLDRGNDFDIAIVDFAMPGTNGIEVAEKILARRQGLPIIIITGYADENVNSSKIPAFWLLKKPFHRDNLAATMIAALKLPESPANNIVPLRTMTATSTFRQPL
jgi:CheY-like chemotaxis protein